MNPIPNFATVDEISQKLQRGEIERWSIDPNQQISNDQSNVRISFFTKDGGLYLVRARYDQVTNQILPPVQIPVPIIRPSLIKWNETHRIIYDSAKATPPIPNGYSDTEINGRVPQDYFNPIFQSIDSFQSKNYKYYLQTANTHNGEQPALVKEWSNDSNSRIQLWITNGEPYMIGQHQSISDEGWYIVYGTPDTFLIVGNYGSHPFVVAPAFSFDNSDGSTDEDFDFPSLNLEQVKYILKTKAPEYIFDQTH